ncbi:MAG TPA: hypothetical protein VNM43_03560 [Dehalococcoidia bacterium]|nr:hypothetical protein [Dehalococcoidia bacterium]
MERDRVDELIAAVVEKLKANREEIRKSLRFGKVVWRLRDGKLDVDLNLNL